MISIMFFFILSKIIGSLTCLEFSLFWNRIDGSCDFHVRLEMLDSRTYHKYGAPREIWTSYKVLDDPNKPGKNCQFCY